MEEMEKRGPGRSPDYFNQKLIQCGMIFAFGHEGE